MVAVHCVDGGRLRTGTYSTSQDAQCSLVDIHDGVVLPFVAIHLLKRMNKSGNEEKVRPTQEDSDSRIEANNEEQNSPDQSATQR